MTARRKPTKKPSISAALAAVVHNHESRITVLEKVPPRVTALEETVAELKRSLREIIVCNNNLVLKVQAIQDGQEGQTNSIVDRVTQATSVQIHAFKRDVFKALNLSIPEGEKGV
jgi:hypothetical protein